MAPRTPEQLPEGKREQPKGMLEAVKEAARKGVGALKQQVEEYKEKPHGTYTFERSAYENVDTKADFERSYKYLVLQTGAAKIDVFLKGVADNTTFQLDPKNPKQVDLDRGPDFQTKFLHALTTLKSTGGVIGLGGLDFNKDGLKAVHKLPLNEQQKVMNHAIAYLRAERLQRDLQNACKGNPPINFLITTEWARDSKTRKATMMDVVVTKDLSTEEMLEKAKPTAQIDRERGQSKLPPAELTPAERKIVEDSIAWFKLKFPGKKPEQRKPDADLDEFLASTTKQSMMSPDQRSPYEKLSPAEKKTVDESVAWLKKFLEKKTVPGKTEPKSAYEQLNPADKKIVDESIAWIRAMQRTEKHKTAQEGMWDTNVQAKAKPTNIPKQPEVKSPSEQLTPAERKMVEDSIAWFKRMFPGKKPEQRKPDADLDEFLASPTKQSMMSPDQRSPYEKLSPTEKKTVDESVAWLKKFLEKKTVPGKTEPKSAYEQLNAADKKKVDESIAWARLMLQANKPEAKHEIPPLLRKEAPEQKYKGGKYWGTTEYPKKPTEAKSAYDQLSPAEKKIVDDSLGRMAPPAPSARMEEQLRQAGLKSAVPPAAKPLEWNPKDYRAEAKELPDLPNDGFTVRKKQTPPPGFEK